MDDLARQLYQTIAAAEEPRLFRRWHASSLASCPKAHYLMRQGVPRLSSPTGAKILRWQAGHHIETAIRPHLVKLYPRLISNTRFTNQSLDLTGEFDNYDPDTKQLIEIKSVAPRAIRYRRVAEQRYHLRKDGPYRHHEWQQHAYVLLLQAADQLVERITYLYISLDGLLLSYSTPVQPDLLGAVSSRLSLLQAAWTAQEAPQCVCREGEEMWKETNQWCDYRDKQKGICCEG